MYVDAFLAMAEAGKLTGARKALDKGRQTYAFAAAAKSSTTTSTATPR